jgi:uncharacterized protein YkwD
MRMFATLGAFLVLVLGSSPDALGLPGKTAQTPSRHVLALNRKNVVVPAFRLRPSAAKRPRLLGTLELDIVTRINAMRTTRGLRPLRVSRQLTAAASYHTRQMGQLGFFEHESVNGAPFWRRIERFYPGGRGYWSVGENLFWESPDTSASSAVREWMKSPPHRQNILDPEWRDLGISAERFESAPGEYGGRSVTIVTTDFGVRR